MAKGKDDENNSGKGGSGKDDKGLNLTIGTPKGTVTAEFKKTDKVADVIKYVVEKLGLGGGSDAFELYLRKGDQKELLTPPERTLVSFGIEDGAKLLLAATGSGV